MKNSKNVSKSNKLKSDNLKLNVIERTLYKILYSTLEKSLMACYEVYQKDLNLLSKVKSYDEFIAIVDKKLKGE